MRVLVPMQRALLNTRTLENNFVVPAGRQKNPENRIKNLKTYVDFLYNYSRFFFYGKHEWTFFYRRTQRSPIMLKTCMRTLYNISELCVNFFERILTPSVRFQIIQNNFGAQITMGLVCSKFRKNQMFVTGKRQGKLHIVD